MRQRFDSIDRERVIFCLQTEFQTRLRPINGRAKYQVANNGMHFVLFGGTQTWHGIDDAILRDLESIDNDIIDDEIVMVVAIVDGSVIRIFLGGMGAFLQDVHILKRLGADQYQFNVRDCGDFLEIVEIPSARLDLYGEFPHGDADRTRIERRKRLTRQIGKLSNEERSELLLKLERRKKE